MATQKAVKIQGKGVVKVDSDAPIPALRDDWVLVRTKAVALNPTDWKHVHNFPAKGATVGCDYAGIVEEVGKNVTGLKKGDRVAGFVHGANVLFPENGAFAQYLLSKGGVQGKIPDSLSFEDASTLGVGVTTVGQGLYQSLGLAWPTNPIKDKIPILIYGGSTATGTLAIQFAKLSGYEVITTASPRNHALLRSLGADHVFDYNDPSIGAQIRALTNDNLKLIFDCYSEGISPQVSCDAMSSTGGTYSNILRADLPRSDIVNKKTLGYTANGETFVRGSEKVPASKEDWEFASKFWALASDLLAQGKIKVHPAKVVDGGLESIEQSLDDLKNGKASGFKYVHVVE